jgi:hypothetical protein
MSAKKEPFETISILLTKEDISYLASILYTIETSRDLRYRFIPARRDKIVQEASDFSRCYFKLTRLYQWFNGATTPVATIEKPVHPRSASYLNPPKKRGKGKKSVA